VTVIAFKPETSTTLQDQPVVPDAVTVELVAAFAHVTCVRPSPDAVPARAIGVAEVEKAVEDVGLVIVTVGGVVFVYVYADGMLLS
jgi:hypothetical protein